MFFCYWLQSLSMSPFKTLTCDFVLEPLLAFDKQISLQMLSLANHGTSSYAVLSENISLSPILDYRSFAAVTNFKLNY